MMCGDERLKLSVEAVMAVFDDLVLPFQIAMTRLVTIATVCLIREEVARQVVATHRETAETLKMLRGG